MKRVASLFALSVLAAGLFVGGRAVSAATEKPAADSGAMLLFLPQISDSKKYAVCKRGCDNRETTCLKAAKDTAGLDKCKSEFASCSGKCNAMNPSKPQTH